MYVLDCFFGAHHYNNKRKQRNSTMNQSKLGAGATGVKRGKARVSQDTTGLGFAPDW